VFSCAIVIHIACFCSRIRSDRTRSSVSVVFQAIPCCIRVFILHSPRDRKFPTFEARATCNSHQPVFRNLCFVLAGDNIARYLCMCNISVNEFCSFLLLTTGFVSHNFGFRDTATVCIGSPLGVELLRLSQVSSHLTRCGLTAFI